MAPRQRGREPGFIMTAAHRAKIQKSNILNALIEHIEGRRDMSATQVSAGLGLLKKCLPDLQAVELTGQDGAPIELNMNVSDDERIKALGVFLAKTGAKPQ